MPVEHPIADHLDESGRLVDKARTQDSQVA